MLRGLVREDSAIFEKRDLVSSWEDRITRGQIDSALEILRLFGLHRIYSEDVMPDTGEAYRYLEENGAAPR